jgi:hypothetical protein
MAELKSLFSEARKSEVYPAHRKRAQPGEQVGFARKGNDGQHCVKQIALEPLSEGTAQGLVPHQLLLPGLQTQQALEMLA